MRFCVLGSGSKGNSTFIAAGKTAILIDGGLSGRETQKRLAAIGVDFSAISSILLTHEHTDHIKGVPVLTRRGKIPVFANPATFRAAGTSLNNSFQYREFNTGTTFAFQDLQIHPFSISHDTADPVGFRISDGRTSLGYCTDTGTVTRLMHHRLSGCQGLILESNHDPELLKKSPYPPFLKQRVRGKTGHLANRDSAICLKDLLHEELTHVVLAHLSETNNLPEIAFRTTMEMLAGRSNCPCISLASQDRVGDLVILE